VENLRRRVAGLAPLDCPTLDSVEKASRDASSDGNDTSSAEDDASSGDNCENNLIPEEEPEFIPSLCLFCPERSTSLETNLEHMQKRHGFFLTNLNLDHLVVDIETLLHYLFLVVFRYHECIFCHSQRRTALAAQQHMLGKGHCILDIDSVDSEYRDFFDFDTDTDTAETRDGGGLSLTGWNEKVVRLPSGKAISSRVGSPGKTLQGYQRRCDSSDSEKLPHAESSIPDMDTNADHPPDAQAVLPVASRNNRRHAPLSTALSKLSINDQQSLAHLLPSEQRSLITTQRKQTDKARRAELRRRSRVELLGNRTLMEHFISETPAMRLRYAWC